MPCTMASSAREAVTRGSFCRSEPAAALRGLAKRRLAGLLEGLVQPLERGLGQEDLAAHLQDLGHVVSGKAGGHRRDRLDVERHVLTGPPVPPGRRPSEPPPLVHQVDGQPVDLQLTQVRPGPAELGRPVGPGAELLGGEHVVQAEQPLQVLHRIEQRRDRAADLLRRRVRRAQLGELFLDLVERAYVARRTRRRRSSASPARGSGTARPSASRSARRAAAAPR